MEMVKHYFNFINIALAAIVLITIIVLIVRISKTVKNVSLIVEDANTFSEGLNRIKEKSETIKDTKDSFIFVGSTYVVLKVLKDAKRYKDKDYSYIQSITRSLADNSLQISRLK